jgi:pyridoxamine 5'-phosphate oxidase
MSRTARHAYVERDMNAGGGADRDRIRDRRVQYETAGLDTGDVDPDPMAQWHRWHDDAFEAGVVEPNAMVVSTVDGDGPDARTVLVRGAGATGFAFFTNYESPKSVQLAANPRAAATFVWLDLHRQVRVKGGVSRLPEADSDAYFASRPRGSQLGAWASPQSRSITGRAELERLVDAVERRFDGVDVPRPPHWGGWLLAPTEWEFWQGRPSRLHDRLRYLRVAEGWAIDRLAP